MFCPECGSEGIEGNKFCPEWGASLRPGAPSGQKVTVANVYRGKKEQIIGGLMVLFGLLGMMGSCAAHSTSDIGPIVSVFATIAGLILWCIGGFQHWYHAE